MSHNLNETENKCCGKGEKEEKVGKEGSEEESEVVRNKYLDMNKLDSVSLFFGKIKSQITNNKSKQQA